MQLGDGFILLGVGAIIFFILQLLLFRILVSAAVQILPQIVPQLMKSGTAAIPNISINKLIGLAGAQILGELAQSPGGLLGAIGFGKKGAS